MSFPTYKHLYASVDYLYYASNYTVDQIANKHKIPTAIIILILEK